MDPTPGSVFRVQEYRLKTSNVEVRADLAADLPRVLANQSARSR